MLDYKAAVAKLRRDAAEAALIRDMATEQTKRDLFGRLQEHLNRLADEVEQAMKKAGDVPSNEPKTDYGG
jgi:hypothetical protein